MTEVFIHSFSRETNHQTCIEQQHKDNERQDTQPRYWSDGINLQAYTDHPTTALPHTPQDSEPQRGSTQTHSMDSQAIVDDYQ